MTTQPPVVVVGAGLAGLRCAALLSRSGLPVVVLEAGDAVGGRVRTDTVEGFTIDRGFQVLSTAYPALRRAVDLRALSLRPLPRGVRVRRGGVLHDVPHPLSSPSAPLRALRSGVVGARGKLALARYAGALGASTPGSIKRRADVTATTAWSASLPDDVVAHVLTPFLSGVVLEPEITTSRVFTDLVMRTFALGSSALPARGMQALPEAIASSLPPAAFRLNAQVAEVDRSSVALVDGTVVDARAVVVATDPWTAHRLVPALGAPPDPRGVTTHYFAAEPWATADGTLVLDADGSGILNSVVLTASVPEYSPDRRALISTSVLPGPDAPDRAEIAATTAELHGAPARSLEHVATRHVPFALPAMPAPLELRKPVHEPASGVWVAGDHRDTSSIQGALVSGARTARAVARAVAVGRIDDEATR